MAIGVLHVVTTGRISGAEKVVSDICTNLDREKFNPIVVCSGEELRDHFLKRNIDCYIIDVNKMKSSEILKLRSLVKSKSVDIIHAHDVKASIASYISTVNLDVPVISHIHSSYLWMQGNSPLKYIDRFFRNRYTMSIPCSKKAEEYYFENNKSVDKSKFHVIGNAFNFKELSEVTIVNKERMKHEIGIDKDLYVFGYLGRFLESKGVDLLINSFNDFTKKYDNSVVLLVGDGDQRDYLKKIVNDYNLNDKVLFLGYQSDIYSYLNLFDAFILPSRLEGLPISVLEAMAMEKTIISTPTAGVPEVIESNYNGILLKERSQEALLEAMEFVYLNPDQAAIMGKRAREFLLKERNISNVIEMLEKLYIDIANN